MANYKEMYLKMFRATTKAIDLLVEAQQKCEELYLSAEETELIILPQTGDEKPPSDEGLGSPSGRAVCEAD